jgi:hypothetical protein
MKKYFDWNRFVRLAKFDYIQRKWFYWGHIPLIFALVSLVHLVSWNVLKSNLSNLTGDGFAPVFFLGFIIATIMISGSSFSEFYKKEASQNYLMIPSSSLEKYLLKFLVGVLPVVLFYPIVYNLAVDFSVWATIHFQKYAFGNIVQVVSDPKVMELSMQLKSSITTPWWSQMTIFAAWLFLPVYLFLSGLLFPKRNRIYAFLTLLALWFIIATFMGLISSIVQVPLPFLISPFILTVEEISISDVFPPSISGPMLVGMMFFWLSIPTMLLLSYFKLKEKEV